MHIEATKLFPSSFHMQLSSWRMERKSSLGGLLPSPSLNIRSSLSFYQSKVRTHWTNHNIIMTILKDTLMFIDSLPQGEPSNDSYLKKSRRKSRRNSANFLEWVWLMCGATKNRKIYANFLVKRWAELTRGKQQLVCFKMKCCYVWTNQQPRMRLSHQHQEINFYRSRKIKNGSMYSASDQVLLGSVHLLNHPL